MRWRNGQRGDANEEPGNWVSGIWGVAFGEFGDNVGIYFHIGIVIVVVS